MKHAYNLLILLLMIPISVIDAQVDSISIDNGFSFNASYKGDAVNVFSGGMKKGSRYLGLANIIVGFESEAAGLWKGTSIMVNGANSHGPSLSGDYIGDAQVVSNIDAGGDHTFLQELWIKQEIGSVSLKFGLQDLNADFVASEQGALFINSSFGVLPTISSNAIASIYPITALGVMFNWQISDKSSWYAAIYDGTTTDFAYNPYNIVWDFKKGDGNFGITEYQHSFNLFEQAGSYRVGAFVRNTIIEKSISTEIPDSLDYTVVGFYAFADQNIWKMADKEINLFFQLGYSPSPSSLSDYYFGLGAGYKSIFRKNGADELGFAVAKQNFANDLGSEICLELTYQTALTSHIYIQPDLQYCIDPFGKISNIDNTFVGTIRFGFTF